MKFVFLFTDVTTPTPHLSPASKKPILNRVKKDLHSKMNSKIFFFNRLYTRQYLKFN